MREDTKDYWRECLGAECGAILDYYAAGLAEAGRNWFADTGQALPLKRGRQIGGNYRRDAAIYLAVHHLKKAGVKELPACKAVAVWTGRMTPGAVKAAYKNQPRNRFRMAQVQTRQRRQKP